MTRIIKPINAARVRRPDGKVVDSEGEPVTWGPYWQRRLDDRSIEILESQAQ